MKRESVSSGVRKKVIHSKDRFWRPVDFEGSPEAVVQTLSRLERAGELVRVRKGLYWRGRPTVLGMSPPPSEEIVGKVVSRTGVGPAGISASLALGLTTQVPRYEIVAVPGRAPKDPPGIKFVSRSASGKRREEHLRKIEIALLEVARDWDKLVEVSTDEATARIEELIEIGTIRMDRIVNASATEPPKTRERLRSLLTTLGRTGEAARIRPARSNLGPQGFTLAG
jgi:hypothetical protein